MAPPPPPTREAARELARAARILTVRARREAAGLFAGAYSSAFRGGGMEFEESRPYVPGDDVRTIDWNATARSGEPYVKRFREERDQTVLLLLDASASMGFASGEHGKAEVAARAAALVAAAAGHAGDRVGLVGFDARIRVELPPERGVAHTWAVVGEAARLARSAGGSTDVARALERAQHLAARRAVLFLISDFRDDALFAGGTPPALAVAGRRHDLVAVVVQDPREESTPAVGPIRVADPEDPSRTLVLATRSARVRGLYRTAASVRARALERRLRNAGTDVVWLPTAIDPLRVLTRFFAGRSGRRRLAP